MIRTVIALTLSTLTFTSSLAQNLNTKPEREDTSRLQSPAEKPLKPLTGDKRWACTWNHSSTQTLYESWRFDSAGTTNRTIEPGGSDRLFVGTNDGWFCWQYGSPIGGDCPNAQRIQSVSGNCP